MALPWSEFLPDGWPPLPPPSPSADVHLGVSYGGGGGLPCHSGLCAEGALPGKPRLERWCCLCPVLQSHPYPEQGLREHRLKSGHAPAPPQALTRTRTPSCMQVHTWPHAWAHTPYMTPAERCWPHTGPLGREGAGVHHHQAPARPLFRGTNTLPPPALLLPQGPWLLPGSSEQRPAGRQVLAMTSA